MAGDRSLHTDAAGQSGALLSLPPPTSLSISTHVVSAPFWQGVIRKLRLNMSLKRSKGGGFELDLTQQRAHKSSKFHGPTISSFSAMLNEPLSLYVTQLEFDSAATETPYVFYPVQSGDTTRCLPSSQWSQFIKGCFRKHTEGGKAPPPKLLRASFISWLRDSTDAPTVLASAAKCMRHQTATQESDHCEHHWSQTLDLQTIAVHLSIC